MKVAIIDHVGIKAGMDCYDLALSNALKQQGCDTTIYSNFQSDDDSIHKIFPFRIKENIFSVCGMLMIYRRISRDLLRRKVQQCIVHGFRFGLAEWLMVKFLKKSSIKMNMIVHDPGSLIGIEQSKRWRKKIFNLCDVIILHNEFSAGELAKELDEPERRKLVVIQHGHFIETAVTATDSAGFMSKNLLDSDKKYLLFFGHIKKTKGLDLLLKALVNTDPDICLVIAGRMRKHSFDEYMVLIDKFKLQYRIKIFPGYVSAELRNELFQMADTIVLPYRKVFQSGVMLMGMSYGKAVIASDLIPNKEIINDGVNGYLFKSNDEASLSSVINKAMRDDVMREEIGKAGKKYVSTNHNWDLIASRWLKLFGK